MNMTVSKEQQNNRTLGNRGGVDSASAIASEEQWNRTDARQARLSRQHECDHKRRAMEESDTGQARLTKMCKTNQQRRQAQRQPESHRSNVGG